MMLPMKHYYRPLLEWLETVPETDRQYATAAAGALCVSVIAHLEPVVRRQTWEAFILALEEDFYQTTIAGYETAAEPPVVN